ncbi:MAG: hydrolase [Candidatus Sericytochromatia bacterium]|nr:MAG: hydrolase [Candidatus Sericytochromatia bacterium]
MFENLKKTYSYGGVVLNKENKVLVVSQYGTSWSLPKGHQEENELPLETAKREIFEESGISDLEYLAHLGSYERYKIDEKAIEDYSELKNITIFLFRTKQEKLKPIDKENPQAIWLSIEEVGNKLTHYKDKEFFEKIKEKILLYI